MFAQSECSLAFIAQALVLTAVLTIVLVYCVRAAARVQAVVPRQRDAIQVELLALHKNLSDLQRRESALLRQRPPTDHSGGGAATGGGGTRGERILPSIG